MYINEFPISSEYDQALAAPKECFKDPDLKAGVITIGSDGYVYSKAGRQSRLYRVITDNKTIAVRCFVSSAAVIPERYRLFQKYLRSTKIDCLVDFELLDEGILVQGSWFPVVKMPWLEGSSLDQYIDKQLHNLPALAWLAAEWQLACRKLSESKISHGDLENSNIIISQNALKIVDYDTIFFPGLTGFADYDTWHPNFQHPERTSMDYGSYVDNFSAWVIFISLYALSIDSSLWLKLECGEQNLLFRHGDFRFPPASKAFYLLDNHENADLRLLSKQLKGFLNQNLITIPDLRLVNALLPNWHEPAVISLGGAGSSLSDTKYDTDRSNKAAVPDVDAETGFVYVAASEPITSSYSSSNDKVTNPLPDSLPITPASSGAMDNSGISGADNSFSENSFIDSFIAQVNNNSQQREGLDSNVNSLASIATAAQLEASKTNAGQSASYAENLPSFSTAVPSVPADKQSRQKRLQKQGRRRKQVKQSSLMISMFFVAAALLILLTVMVLMTTYR